MSFSLTGGANNRVGSVVDSQVFVINRVGRVMDSQVFMINRVGSVVDSQVFVINRVGRVMDSQVFMINRVGTGQRRRISGIYDHQGWAASWTLRYF
jgi:hypothetical protein